MVSKLKKFRLMLWKNCLPLHDLFILGTLLSTVALGVLLLFAHLPKIIDETMMNKTAFNPFCIPSHTIKNIQCRDEKIFKKFKNKYLAYSPLNKKTDHVIEKLRPLFKGVRGFENGNKLQEHFMDILNLDQGRQFIAVQLQDDPQSLPCQVEVVIRFPSELSANAGGDWKTNSLFRKDRGTKKSNLSTGDLPNYYEEGFLALQYEIFHAIFDVNQSLSSEISLQQFPQFEWIDDTLLKFPTQLLFIIMFTLISPSIFTIYEIVKERHNQIVLETLGFSKCLCWLSWLTRGILFLVPYLICFLAILKLMQVFDKTDITLLSVIFILHLTSFLAFCVLLSTFFTSETVAFFLIVPLIFASAFPYWLLTNENWSFAVEIIFCLLSNTAFGAFLNLLMDYEMYKNGLNWNNLWNVEYLSHKVCGGLLLIMLAVDTILYLAVAICIETVFNQTPEISKRISLLSYSKRKSSLNASYLHTVKTTIFENVLTNEIPTIQLKNVSIIDNKRMVKNISFDAYEEQITVVAGQRNSGKSTIMLAVVGLIRPNSGDILLEGYGIFNRKSPRKGNFGVCFHDNRFFQCLTVEEHFYFIGFNKGLTKAQIVSETEKYVSNLHLSDYVSELAGSLSRNLSRKLSVALAFFGQSKIVLLDEPTIGVDNSCRRDLWNFIKSQRKNRTIMLFTSMIEEAEFLGDKLAIIDKGLLKCYGSSIFIKQKYGAGYYLIIKTFPDCNPSKITNIIKRYIESATVIYSVGQNASDLIYFLSDSHVKKFPGLLQELELKMKDLSIHNFIISFTTLEEVLFTSPVEENQLPPPAKMSTQESIWAKTKTVSGCNLFITQCLAMFKKHIYLSRHHWKIILLQIAIPLICVIFCHFLNRNPENYDLLPTLPLTLNNYKKPVILVEKIDKFSNNTHKYTNALENGIIKEIGDIPRTVLDLAKNHYIQKKFHHIVGFSFMNTSVIAWFNGDAYHSAPLALTLILKSLHKNSFGSACNIEFNNYPLPWNLTSMRKKIESIKATSSVFDCFDVGLTLSTCFFVIFSLEEKRSKFKQLQFLSGLKTPLFWFSNITRDIFILIITIGASILAFYLLVGEKEVLIPIASVSLCFGLAVITLSYVVSLIFREPFSGISLLLALGLLTNFILTYLRTRELSQYYAVLLIVLPHYHFSTGLYGINVMSLLKKKCNAIANNCLVSGRSKKECDDLNCELIEKCCDFNYYNFHSPGVGKEIVILLCMTLVLTCIVLGIESNPFQPKKVKNSSLIEKDYTDEDENDVTIERKKILTTSKINLQKEYVMIFENFSKLHGKRLTLNRLSFGIKPAECFCILGSQGSRCNTIFPILMGLEKFSDGNVWVNGLDITNTKESKEIKKRISYCPEECGLSDALSVKEHLKIFSLIRGIPRSQCDSVIDDLSAELNLTEHLHKSVWEIDTEVKKLFTVALGLIGGSQIYCFDAPTRGLSSVNKHRVWNCINKLRSMGKTTFVTTRNLEECEAIATRMAIISGGEFQAIGTVKHLRDIYSAGFFLILKIGDQPYQDIKIYYNLDTKESWRQLFTIWEKRKYSGDMVNYSLGKCSLEQVISLLTNDEHQKYAVSLK